MAGLRGPHALAENLDLVGILAAAHAGDRVDENRSIGIAHTVMNAQTRAVGIYSLQWGKLPGSMAGRLAVIPGDNAAVVGVGLLDGLGHAIVINQRRMAILAEEQVTAEAGCEAERIDIEIGQVDQMQGIGEPNMVAVRLGIELLP